jgi:DNA-binding HxlR family transcriptional regulator
MKSKLPLTKLLLIANRISPKTTIPLAIAIRRDINRFSTLAEVYPMSSRTLAKALSNMQKEEMIVKNDNGSYALTKKGNEFADYAELISKWAEKYYDIKII